MDVGIKEPRGVPVDIHSTRVICPIAIGSCGAVDDDRAVLIFLPGPHGQGVAREAHGQAESISGARIGSLDIGFPSPC